ncbi:site-specific integrase [Mesorhizobium sp. BR-1-1-8]|uniref:tyrosine-type recombinase/integrase n=1 Tax=Mesorhizobium sp. BR-1-1-8 TaxID=2876659 RepID=UPI001CCD1064|nr:site-specific integrase [Mesorhizobium sp. BR-1-1-8]MBZ9980418.1 site-specific integrase [Mesorhizobium sp. BR-1-1-8]
MVDTGRAVWQCDYRDGEGKRRSKQFNTKTEATAWWSKAGIEVGQGTHVADSASITVAEAATLWLAHGKSEGLERSTLAAYEQHVRLHINPLIGARKLSQLKTPAIEAFKDTLMETRSRPMVKRVMVSLSGIFLEAQRRGKAAHNPVSAVKVKTDKRRKERVEMPTKEELRAILRGASVKWKPLIWTASFTGLRGSELRGLRWPNVDLDAAVLKVRERVDSRNQFGPPKSEAGTRDVPLPPTVVSILRDWKKACPKGEHNLVFPNGAGNIENHQNLLKRCFFPLQVSEGITVDSGKKDEDGKPIMAAKYGLHALRHAAAALFIEQNLKPKKVQELMGHASIQITFDLYGYLFKDDEGDAAAMKAIEDRLIGA